MSTDIVLPIIVADGLDVCLYRTVSDAALALEGPDVLAGIYRAYDAAGRPLQLRTDGGPHDYSARVHIELGTPTVVQELRALLQDFLAAAGHPMPLDTELRALVSATEERVGYSR